MTKLAVTLYEIKDSLREAYDNFDPETGELPLELITELKDAFQNKGTAIGYLIKNADIQEDLCKAQKDLWAKRERACKAKRERIKQYLYQNMVESGINSIVAQDGSVDIKLMKDRDESVDVFDVDLLPKEFIKTKVEVSADKIALKKALKDGADIQGARIVKRDRLVIK